MACSPTLLAIAQQLEIKELRTSTERLSPPVDNGRFDVPRDQVHLEGVPDRSLDRAAGHFHLHLGPRVVTGDLVGEAAEIADGLVAEADDRVVSLQPCFGSGAPLVDLGNQA